MARNTKSRNGASGSEPGAMPVSAAGGSFEEQMNSPDAIAKRAYEIYQSRGGSHGADLDDWLEAERQLRRGPSDVTGPARSPSKPRRRKASGERGI